MPPVYFATACATKMYVSSSSLDYHLTKGKSADLSELPAMEKNTLGYQKRLVR